MKNLTLLGILLFTGAPVSAQLTLRVVSVPANTPADAELYVAGDFQGWDPADPDYRLTKNPDGTHEITIQPPMGLLSFKFTRGTDWSTVEGDENGNFRPNRTYQYDGGPDTLEAEILGWEDLGGGGGSGNSTAAANVSILDEDFFIPQLNRTRRIWIYLPPDYDSSAKRYPVLYMHDGQNVFDAATSFAGEWKVDESLNELFDMGDYGCIVVAIDNGGTHRLDEYSPWVNPSYGGGQGDEYIQFIAHTLKPHIDSTFRTRPEREFTGIMGSSMGGLISHYAIVEYQDVFGKAGVFSPSYWFSQEVFTHTQNSPRQGPVRIYTIVGAGEGAGMVNGVNQMHQTLLESGYSESELMKEIHSDGEHSEWYWAREFPGAYLWLFGDLPLNETSPPSPEQRIRLFPNPVNKDRVLNIQGLEGKGPWEAAIHDGEGKLVRQVRLQNGRLKLEGLPKGFYTLKIQQGVKTISTHKVLVL